MIESIIIVTLLGAELPFYRQPPSKIDQVVTGPRGEQHEQFKLVDWNELTLLDLQKSKFFANENGPYSTDSLPKEWPSPADLNKVPEASQEEKYPVALKGGPHGIYVLGGSVIGVQPRELPWRLVKKLYDGDALRIESSGPIVVDGLYSENVEDAFSPRGTGNWLIRNAHAKYLRDDFVENDGLLPGEIDDCLVEGCHVFISARPGKRAAEKTYEAKKDDPPHIRIRDTLVHIPPLPYDGDMKLEDRESIVDGKAGGKLFKWSPAGGTLDVENCVFRLDAVSPSGPKSMEFPQGTYRNVTLVWLGPGEYPTKLPAGVTATRDVTVWDKARDKWLRKHNP